jgi:hypothetical protein
MWVSKLTRKAVILIPRIVAGCGAVKKCVLSRVQVTITSLYEIDVRASRRGQANRTTGTRTGNICTGSVRDNQAIPVREAQRATRFPGRKTIRLEPRVVAGSCAFLERGVFLVQVAVLPFYEIEVGASNVSETRCPASSSADNVWTRSVRNEQE